MIQDQPPALEIKESYKPMSEKMEEEQDEDYEDYEADEKKEGVNGSEGKISIDQKKEEDVEERMENLQVAEKMVSDK